MASFHQLPAELQIQIFSYLTKSDVKAARGVSRKFRDNATPELFRSILACARYRAMGAFQNISLHSVYPSYVKEIVFDGSVYDASLAKHLQAYEQMQKEIPDLQLGPSWGMRPRWKRYQTLYNDQEDMKTSGVLLQTMARALEWMPNISRIVYSPHANHVLPVEAKDMRDLLPRSFAHSTRYPPRWLYDGSSEHPFRHLIGAIYISQFASVREFRTEPLPNGNCGTEFSLSMFDFPQAQDFEAGKFFFQHLTKLELNMAVRDYPHRPSMHDSEAAQQLTNLAKLIASATELRHLALHLSNWNISAQVMYGPIVYNDQPIFRSLGLRTRWPKLRSLSLGGVHAHEKDILNLMKRHENTLKSLTFTECSLSSGVWAEIVDEVLFSSYINAFVLDRVNETDLPGYDWMSQSMEETESLRYEGHLVVSEDGERNFVRTESTQSPLGQK